MLSKIYVGIIVLIILVFLHFINMQLHYVDKQYSLEYNYGVPIKCVSNSLCSMNGNIFLLFIIYLIIPDEYFGRMLDMLDPKQIHKNAENDILGINKFV